MDTETDAGFVVSVFLKNDVFNMQHKLRIITYGNRKSKDARLRKLRHYFSSILPIYPYC